MQEDENLTDMLTARS